MRFQSILCFNKYKRSTIRIKKLLYTLRGSTLRHSKEFFFKSWEQLSHRGRGLGAGGQGYEGARR